MTPFDGPPASSPAPHASAEGEFLADVVVGLGASPKRLSPKHFYDTEGSRLFDAICTLPEYYVTRTEAAILDRSADAIAAALGPCRLVEPGAGSSTKTRRLLRALGPERCRGYVPVDIAGEHLARSAAALRAELPWLRVAPVAADFTASLPVPPADDARTVVYFPGSTLGNFDPAEARMLLERFRAVAGAGGSVLVGLDLKKDPRVLHAAYNDAAGVTAAFNKNVLRRMNDELGADVDLAAFHHYAFYAPEPGRIEMHLVSARRQTVHVGGRAFTFREGESLCTERSYKFDLASAERLFGEAGLTLHQSWLDPGRYFAVLLFGPARRSRAS